MNEDMTVGGSGRGILQRGQCLGNNDNEALYNNSCSRCHSIVVHGLKETNARVQLMGKVRHERP